MTSTTAAAVSFLTGHAEKLVLNQYWYSEATIKAIVEDIYVQCGMEEKESSPSHSGRCAFVSTPSLYFSIPTDSEDGKNWIELRKRCNLFDYDEKFASDPLFVFFDFHHVDKIPPQYHHQFDYIVIDPPFITEDVWQCYTNATKLLMAPNAKILLSSIPENAEMLSNMLDVHICNFRPSIPNLIYQYSFFSNYNSFFTDSFNPEIDYDEYEQQKKQRSAGVTSTNLISPNHSSRKKTKMEGFGSDSSSSNQ
jgi:hypothetical protein